MGFKGAPINLWWTDCMYVLLFYLNGTQSSLPLIHPFTCFMLTNVSKAFLHIGSTLGFSVLLMNTSAYGQDLGLKQPYLLIRLNIFDTTTTTICLSSSATTILCSYYIDVPCGLFASILKLIFLFHKKQSF